MKRMPSRSARIPQAVLSEESWAPVRVWRSNDFRGKLRRRTINRHYIVVAALLN
jgi:hypothetical protein